MPVLLEDSVLSDIKTPTPTNSPFWIEPTPSPTNPLTIVEATYSRPATPDSWSHDLLFEETQAADTYFKTKEEEQSCFREP